MGDIEENTMQINSDVHAWKTALSRLAGVSEDKALRVQLTHQRIPQRLFRSGTAGRLALITLPDSGSPASDMNLAEFRWRAIIESDRQILMHASRSPVRSNILREISCVSAPLRRALREYVNRTSKIASLNKDESAFLKEAASRI